MPWRVESGPAEAAVAYLGGAGRAGIVDAGLLRGDTSEAFLRQLLHARPGGRGAAATASGPLLFAVPPWAQGWVGELVQERCHSGSLVERDAAALVRALEQRADEPDKGCPAGALDEAALAEETARWLESLPAQGRPARTAGAEDRERLAQATAARVGWLALQGSPARAGQPPPGGATPGVSPGLEQALATVARPKVSVVITHYNRPELLPLAIRSVAEQTWPGSHLELVVIDDGSPDPEVQKRLDEIEAEFRFQERGWRLLREPNRYLGGARNAALRNATGEYVLFMDDDNYAKPLEVEFFARAAENSASDVLTSGLDFVHGKEAPPAAQLKFVHKRPWEAAGTGGRSPYFVFLGGSAEAGLFKNAFGDANSFHRRAAFEDLGGYTTDRHVGYEDWEFYSKAAFRGFSVETVPFSLYHYRFTAGSMQKSTSYSKSRRRALRQYLGQSREFRRAAQEAETAAQETPQP